MRRQSILWAVPFALLGTSYVSDEPVMENVSSSIISYSVITQNHTRAVESFCANNMPEEFRVYSFLNGTTPFIDGDRIVRDGDSWYDADGLRYWPDGEDVDMSFYAVVNDNGCYSAAADGGQIVNWSVLPDVEQQLDLMYAGVQNVSTNTTVGLNFRHALSQVCYKAKNENPNLQITVNSITVGNVAGTGTFTLPANSNTTDNIPGHGAVVSEEDIVETGGNWTMSDDQRNFVIDKLGTDKGSGVYSGVTLAKPDEDGNGVVTNISAVIDTQTEHWSEKALMMLPQTVSASDPAVDEDPATGSFFKLNLTLDNVLNDGTTVLITTRDFYVPVDLKWKAGNRYIYTFHFPKDWNPDGLDPINYDINVDDSRQILK